MCDPAVPDAGDRAAPVVIEVEASSAQDFSGFIEPSPYVSVRRASLSPVLKRIRDVRDMIAEHRRRGRSIIR